MKTKPEAVIFDMDGVIVDSEPWWLVAMDKHFGLAGVDLSAEDYRATTGLRLDQVIEYWYSRRDFGETAPQKLAEDIYTEVLKLVTQNAKLMPGLRDLLASLSDARIPIALASSSSMGLISGIVDFYKIRSYFAVIQSADAVPLGKPHPQVFIQTAKKLGVKDVTKCVVIEDSLNGLTAARAARMPCVIMPETHKRELMQWSIAQKMISSLTELQGEWYADLV